MDTLARVEAWLVQGDFIQAVADAVRGMMATAALLSSDKGARQLAEKHEGPASGRPRDYLVPAVAQAVWAYAKAVTDVLVRRLNGEEGEAGVSLPPPLTGLQSVDILDTVIKSELLAAAAATVVGCPSPFADRPFPETARDSVCRQIEAASFRAADTLGSVAKLQRMLLEGGREECGGPRLALGLIHSVQHEAVQRLQVGLLDQLAAHAGMGAQLLDGHKGSGAGGQKQLGREEKEAKAGAWVARSGAWWLATEEAKRGQPLAMTQLGPSGGDGAVLAHGAAATAGLLQMHYANVARATIVPWHSLPPGSVAARPPPLLLARLTARAAEALCRLGRGQGLDGACTPVPEGLSAATLVSK